MPYDDRPFCEDVVVFEDCRCLRATSKAILVLIPEIDEDEPQWVPQSQVHDDSEVWKAGDEGELVLTKWIVEQKGWG
jgi:hypothetical protein